MSGLDLNANIEQPDDFYARLLRMHEGLDREQSSVINAKLILLLANHIGDERALSDALYLAGSKNVLKSSVEL